MSGVSRERFEGLGEDLQPSPELLGHDLAELVERRFMERLRSRDQPTSARTNRASSMGDPCLRRLVLKRTVGEQERQPDDTGLAIFNLGHMLEGPVRRLVEDLGFEVEKAQLAFPPNDFNVSGHIDGVIRHPRFNIRCILEIKGVNGQTWKGLRTADDIREHSKSWVNKWGAQGQLYPVLSDIMRWGEDDIPIIGTLFVLLNKWTGELRAVFALADYAQAEALLDKSLAIEVHVAAKTLPDFCAERGECLTCGFRPHACQPPLVAADTPLRIFTEPEVLAALEMRQNAAGAVADYKEADEYLFGEGGVLRGCGLAIIPCPEEEWDFHVTGGWSSNTTYKVPAEVKAPYKEVDAKGKWLKKIAVVPRRPAGDPGPSTILDEPR